MAIFTHHEPCPKCNSRDNLARYSDGGGFCFGCSYSISSSVSGFVREAILNKDYQQQEEEKTWSLPDDLTQDFPPEVLTLIQKYSLTIEELIKYDYYFSRRTRRLWRILESTTTDELRTAVRTSDRAAEARSCDDKHASTATTGNKPPGSTMGSYPKARFYGSKETTFALAGTEHPSTHLVVVEDGFSSIKIGRVTHSIPLFGTSISMTKLSKLAHKYQQVTVWLDHDKFKEAWEIALKFKWLGVHTNVVLTALDPKYYTETEIKQFLNVTKV